jgi:hypothetical protein
MKRHALQSAIASTLLLAVGACGSLESDDTPGQVLLTLTGEVTNQAQITPASEVRMALVWSAEPLESETAFNASQDVPMTAQFPATFSIEITSPPPAELTISRDDLPEKEKDELPPGFAFAIGTLAVYEDRNGNGQLDLIGGGADAIDGILGLDEELLVLYFEGSWQLGYNLVRIPDCVFGIAGGHEPPCSDSARVFAPVDGVIADLQIPLSADPKLARWMCERFDDSDSIAVGRPPEDMGTATPPAGYPAMDDPNIYCGFDGRSYVYQNCVETMEGPCSGSSITCTDATQWHVPDAASPPADWPCIIAPDGGSGVTPVPAPA